MKIFIAGGAGFIGSHMAKHQLAEPNNEVTVFDNFSSGQERHLNPYLDSPRLKIVRGDLKELGSIRSAIKGADCVFHYASNPDIAKAMVQPDIDFWEGTYLTQNLLEAMRIEGVGSIVYASGSGVYGDVGDLEVTEDHAPMAPISLYGASKLACEAMIHAYTQLFGMTARVFRFANVVGDEQTHGVAYDFIRQLVKKPKHLRVLGDGTQSKSYIHVDDVVRGQCFFTDNDTGPYTYYHFATGDYLTVREIADMVVEEMGLKEVTYTFTGGDRGWRGDVPVVRFNLDKVHARGWRSRFSSREAMRTAIRAMLAQVAVG